MPAPRRPLTLDLDTMVRGGSFQRIVHSALARQAEAAGADIADVQQDVAVKVLEAQERPRARYDAERGASPHTYVFRVAKTRGADALRRPGRQRVREVPILDREWTSAPSEGTDEGAMRRVLALLDTAEEKEMAMHLATGATLAEIQRAMKLSESRASELRTRVRALLLPLRQELDEDGGGGGA